MRDFLVLVGVLSTFGGLGIYEGYVIHPAFYVHSAVIFVALGVAGYKLLYADKKQGPVPDSHLDAKNRKTDSLSP